MKSNSYDAVAGRILPAGVRRFLWIALAAIVVIAMMPTAGLGGKTGKSYAADPVVLTVAHQYGNDGTPDSTREYTQAELEAIATTAAFGYVTYDTAWNVIAAKKSIPLFDLLKDAGVKTGTDDGTIASGVTLKVENASGSDTWNYQDFNGNRGLFFPDTTASAADAGNAVPVPPVIALEYGTVAPIATTAEGDLADAYSATGIQSIRYLKGFTVNEYTASTSEALQASTAKLRDGVTTITVIEPAPLTNFEIIVKENADQKIQWKQYTRTALEALALHEPRGYLMSGWTVHASNSYIPVEDLLADCGIKMSDVVTLRPEAGDGFGRDFTAAALAGGQYFYPASGQLPADTDTAGATTVGAVLALDWNSAPVAATASETLSNIVRVGEWLTSGRFYIGLSETDYLANAAAGNRFVTAPIRFIVTVNEGFVANHVAGLTGDIKELEDDVKKLEGDITNLEKDKSALATDKANITSNQETLTTEKNNLTAERDALKNQLTDLKKQLDTAKQNVFKGLVPGISSLKAGKKQATATWKKIGTATGYQIVYAAKKNFKGKKTVKVNSVSAVKKTIKPLKKGSTYYFKVRGYMKAGGKTIYTKYSAVKTVKIK